MGLISRQKYCGFGLWYRLQDDDPTHNVTSNLQAISETDWISCKLKMSLLVSYMTIKKIEPYFMDLFPNVNVLEAAIVNYRRCFQSCQSHSVFEKMVKSLGCMPPQRAPLNAKLKNTFHINKEPLPWGERRVQPDIALVRQSFLSSKL